MKINDLIDQGHNRVRLPTWNEYAYLQIRDGGVWADLFDVGAGLGGGDPIAILVADCAAHLAWEPVLSP